MKLKTGNPRVRGPRKQDRRPKERRAERRGERRGRGAEPATFAWVEPLGESRPVVVEREVVVEHEVEREVIVEKPVLVEKEIQVDRPVYIDREVIVEKPIEVTKEVIVEKEVFVDREVPVEVTKEVIVEREVEVEVEKPVFIEKQVIVEKPVEVTKEVIVEKLVEVEKTDKSANKTEAKAKKQKVSKEPKAIVVGRGPSVWSRLARVMPAPKPVLAGAMTLLLAIVSLALISPSGDNATAGRAALKAPVTESTGSAPADIKKVEREGTKGESRNPFAAKGYEEELAAKAAAEKKAKAAAAKKKAEAAQTKAAAPASAATSLYTADLTTYSSYTPWKKTTKRAGGWIDFGGKPTVKVLSIGKASIMLFVVTDVEVIEDKSKGIKHDKPIRQIRVNNGGTVRFADYRDIQGDDVTYTIRYDGSDKIKLSDVKN